MASTNRAAWLQQINKPLAVGPSETGKLGKKEVLVRNHAVAINPVDWMVVCGAFPAGALPRTLGNDVAGEVVEVGEDVTYLKVGDRVLGHCLALITNEARHGGFQQYTVMLECGCAILPDGMEYKNASVLPLGLSTAAMGLFQKEHLGLRLPGSSNENQEAERKKEEAVLVWGGSSSVGSAAIQLARAAGYVVITTCSLRNAAMCKDLGAEEVLDHSSPGIVGDLVKAMKGYTCVGGIDAISIQATQQNMAEVLVQLGVGKFSVTLPVAQGLPPQVDAKLIAAAFILTQDRDLAKAIYNEFLSGALKRGVIKPAPPADVVGHSLEDIQTGIDILKAGVSGKKVVITI